MAGTVVICFTDIVGSTELLTRLGDDRFDDVRRRHFDLLEREVETHGGEVVKSLGDGLMLAFGSASDAVSAAVAMQRAIDAASRGRPIALRYGLGSQQATPRARVMTGSACRWSRARGCRGGRTGPDSRE